MAANNRLRKCNHNNSRINDENYRCNVYTGHWIHRNGRVARLIDRREATTDWNIARKCQDHSNSDQIKAGWICNPLTGHPIKIGGPTHRRLAKMNYQPESTIYKFDEIILYDVDLDGYTQEVKYKGTTSLYIIYPLNMGDNPHDILHKFNTNNETLDRYKMNHITLLDIDKHLCNQTDISEQTCQSRKDLPWGCEWKADLNECHKKSQSPYTGNRISQSPIVPSPRVGDIIQLYERPYYDKDDPLIRYLVLRVKKVPLISYMDNTSSNSDDIFEVRWPQLSKRHGKGLGSEAGTQCCNEIIALVHGTFDDSLIKIIDSNQITAQISPMGVGHKAVSVYPILDCDRDHALPLQAMWGTCKIFLGPKLLIDYPKWRLSLETDISADPQKQPYASHNKTAYYRDISIRRHNVWSDLYFDDFDATNLNDALGELNFPCDLKKIRNYILFVAIDPNNHELIAKVQSEKIKVIPIDSPNAFQLKDKL